jgi:hypothetical protein
MIIYKIIGDDFINSIPKISLFDWSGIYFQFTIEHALRYVSKKWEDGNNKLYLIKIELPENLPIYKLEEDLFSYPYISGEEKAIEAKKLLNEKYNLKIGNKDKLIEKIQGGLLIKEYPDEFEIVFSHSIVNEYLTNYQILFEFKNENKNLFPFLTTHWKIYNNKDENNCWYKCNVDESFDTYLLVKNKSFLEFLNKQNFSN